jgi:hypothetical protein
MMAALIVGPQVDGGFRDFGCGNLAAVGAMIYLTTAHTVIRRT